MKRPVSIAAGIILYASLSACSTINNFLDSKVSVDYGNSSSVKALEIPPDLTSPQFDSSFDLPAGGSVSAVAMQNGGNAAAANTAVATPLPAVPARAGNLSSIRTVGGEAVLQIHDTPKRALIMTDIILERLGFTIVGRNPAQGLYQVQYNGEDVEAEQNEAFLKRLFKFSAADHTVLKKGSKLQIQVTQEGGNSFLRVKDEKGAALNVGRQTSILAMLNREFNG